MGVFPTFSRIERPRVSARQRNLLLSPMTQPHSQRLYLPEAGTFAFATTWQLPRSEGDTAVRDTDAVPSTLPRGLPGLRAQGGRSKDTQKCPFPSRKSGVGSTASMIPRNGSGGSPHTQFSSSIFRGSVSSSASSLPFPFFLPLPFPLPPLVVAVGGCFSLSVALLSAGGARLPRGCSPRQAELGGTLGLAVPRGPHRCMHAHVHPCAYICTR